MSPKRQKMTEKIAAFLATAEPVSAEKLKYFRV